MAAAAAGAAAAGGEPPPAREESRGEDPFDAADFDVTSYVNRLFPNGASPAPTHPRTLPSTPPLEPACGVCEHANPYTPARLLQSRR